MDTIWTTLLQKFFSGVVRAQLAGHHQNPINFLDCFVLLLGCSFVQNDISDIERMKLLVNSILNVLDQNKHIFISPWLPTSNYDLK